MIWTVTYSLLIGMMAGLAAYLQADSGGWRLFVTIGVIFAAAWVLLSGLVAPGAGAPKHPAAGPITMPLGCCVVMLCGAATGQNCRRRITPLTLGLRTTPVAAVLFFMATLWSGANG